MCGMSVLGLISCHSATVAKDRRPESQGRGFLMLMKISGLARALYIVLAIVAGFVAVSMMNVPLVLVVLGLVAGVGMSKENYVPAAATALVLPILGTALSQIPAVGAQLNAVAGNLQMGVAGA